MVMTNRYGSIGPVTSDAAVENQTTESLGVFKGQAAVVDP